MASSPTYGELRNSLLHAGGRVETSKPFEALQWFKQGDVVVLNPDRFHEIMDRLRAFPDGLHTPGFDPFPGLKRYHSEVLRRSGEGHSRHFFPIRRGRAAAPISGLGPRNLLSIIANCEYFE